MDASISSGAFEYCDKKIMKRSNNEISRTLIKHWRKKIANIISFNTDTSRKIIWALFLPSVLIVTGLLISVKNTNAHYIQSHLEMISLAQKALSADKMSHPRNNFILTFLNQDAGNGKKYFEYLLDGARDADLRVNGIYNIDPFCNDYNSGEMSSDFNTYYNPDYDYVYDYKTTYDCNDIKYKDIADWPVGDHGYNPYTQQGFFSHDVDAKIQEVVESDRLDGLLSILDGTNVEEKLNNLRNILNISNARAMAEEFYTRAQTAWQDERYIDSMYNLGIVMHLAQDISAPPHIHSGEQILNPEFHDEFERQIWVNYLLALNGELPENISPQYKIADIGVLIHDTAISAFLIPNDIPSNQIMNADLVNSVRLAIESSTAVLLSFFRYLPMVACGGDYSVGLKSDGSVVAVGENSLGQCNVKEWTEIVQLAVGVAHTVGLKGDGSVLATGSNYYGQCAVTSWTDIMQVTGGGSNTVGLKNDGTVVCVGDNNSAQCEVDSWNNIVQVSSGINHTIGLGKNGTVIAVGNNDYGKCEVDSWTDIVQVATYFNHTVGLKNDGTVVCAGSNNYGQCDINDWNDIVHIAVGSNHTIGVKGNGNVLAVGANFDNEIEVTGWRDISLVAAGTNHTVGLRPDGTAVAVGTDWDNPCDVGSWTDIVQVAANEHHTVGLKNDGTVLTAGGDVLRGYRNVSEWSNIGQVSDGLFYTIGLKNDGTVVCEYSFSSIGPVGDSYCDVENWSNIIQVDAGTYHSVGLRSDGSVVAAGLGWEGELDVTSWQNMKQVIGGLHFTVGLSQYGFLTAVGLNYPEYYNGSNLEQIDAYHQGMVSLDQLGNVQLYGEYDWFSEPYIDVSGWNNIEQVAAGNQFVVGLKDDGTVVADGLNYVGQCNVSRWSEIIQIAAGADHTVAVKSDGTVVTAGGSEGPCHVTNWDLIEAIIIPGDKDTDRDVDGSDIATFAANFNGHKSELIIFAENFGRW